MPVIQVSFYVPNDIRNKILTGECRIDRGVVRYATGPKKGQILKHLDPIELNEDFQQAESFEGRSVQFIKNNKRTIVVGGIILTVLAAGTYIYYRMTKSEAVEVKNFRAQLKTYIDELRNGTLQLISVKNLLNSIHILKSHKSFKKIKIKFSLEELDVLVRQIHDYTIQFAKINNYSISDEDLLECEDSIENLQKHLTIQQRIFEFAA